MGSKTISLDDDAYGILAAAKRQGESFSDVVKRVFSKKAHPLLRLQGILSPEDAEDVRAAIERMRAMDIEEQDRKLARWKR